MDDKQRLIEHAFPLRQASIDSVHEKNVRHGHISTLHIWPARRPLAACRAALIATLLPDPGTSEERKIILEKLGGKVINVQKKTVNETGKSEKKYVEETEGGILHWGRESTVDFAWFREEIRKAYGGRAPKVLDPFAGGGAIPLEAMRLGCETTAMDINPVAWFILKCTLEYPQKLADQRFPLPKFALESPEFMDKYNKEILKNSKKKGSKNKSFNSTSIQSTLSVVPDVDLSWHVRAWGWWVLQQSKKDLEEYYPMFDGKSSLVYLWARTVKCKNCGTTIPLLKTRWLCKKKNKRVLLTVEPNEGKNGVVFGIYDNVPLKGKTAAERRGYDKQIGQGTMSRNGAWCPCCGKPGSVAMQMEDIKFEGKKKQLGTVLTCVIVDGKKEKEYRSPFDNEKVLADIPFKKIEELFQQIPFNLPTDNTPKTGIGASRAFSVDMYGFDQWVKLFNQRQLFALGTFIKNARLAKQTIEIQNYPSDWVIAISSYLSLCSDRITDRNSTLSWWQTNAQKIGPTFTRWALPITWDFAEITPWVDASGGYLQNVEWVSEVIEHLSSPQFYQTKSKVILQSAIQSLDQKFDIIVTDPPYYDAIPYSDLMDFYYIWLKRSTQGLSKDIDDAFVNSLSPKWNETTNDGELIDDAGRFDGDKNISRKIYEDGMFRAFQSCNASLTETGKLVVVFAHKHPDAWEALVTAIIKSGFVVDASWPIQTERVGRIRSASSAALSSSIWLVCKKRPETARPGWDNQVMEEMQKNIDIQLREFWDAGIRGPDFIWAATGPALEAYSKHPIVKKANAPGQIMTVSEFLHQVRRLVVDFVVGRVLSKDGNGSSQIGLDDVTTYYLLHRNDFGFEKAPAGACILYAVSCGLSDSSLAFEYDIIQRTGSKEAEVEEDEGEIDDESDEEESPEGKGSTVSLKTWKQRKGKNLGIDINGRPAPMIDRIHQLMHLWRAGDEVKVNDYLDRNGLWNNTLFHHLLQAIIEMSKEGDEERAALERISNHIVAKGGVSKGPKTIFAYEGKDSNIQGEEKR